MQTSLGGATQAAAAWRTGLSQRSEILAFPYFDSTHNEPQFVVGHAAAGENRGFRSAGRLVRLAGEALHDLRASGALDDVDPATLGVYLVFESGDSTADLEDRTSHYVDRLLRAQGLPVDPAAVTCFFDGLIGFHLACTDAAAQLDAGHHAHALIGVADSLIDPLRLADYIAERRVKTADEPVGLEPGEAACFLLLEKAEAARGRGVRPLGVLHATAFALPRGGAEEAVPGHALSEAMARALAAAAHTPDADLTLYLNAGGTHDEALDIGHALAGLRRHYALDAWATKFPATSFGYTGAASGSLLIGLAARAFARGYHHGDTALVALLADGSYRVALALTRWPEPTGPPPS